MAALRFRLLDIFHLCAPLCFVSSVRVSLLRVAVVLLSAKECLFCCCYVFLVDAASAGIVLSL